MKKIIQNIRNNYLWSSIFLVVGIFLGWLFFHSSGEDEESSIQNSEVHDHSKDQNTIWTCSMHPQIRQDKPGKCPICAMDLIPLSDFSSDGEDVHPDEIQMTESAKKLADVQTMIVQRNMPEKTLFLQGKVQPDERRIAKLTARFNGRIEKLFVSFTGEYVSKGQKLATVYSPDLLTAQRELLEASAYKNSRPNLYQAARTKLKLWDLTEGQIDAIEENGTPQLYFDILSPIAGTVTQRNVALGDYLKEGNVLFEVTDLFNVWIMFDAYESDLPWISTGDQVSYNIQSVPGKTFKGRVDYIDPFIHPETRVAKVRVQQRNNDLTLKPEMFANGTIISRKAGSTNEILIPKSSILWTGKRAVVYVKIPDRPQPTFLYREIELGPESGQYYVVNGGLKEGEEIVTNGVFKIDAAAQLAGKPSMMNPDGGNTSLIHNHGVADKSQKETHSMEQGHSGHDEPGMTKTQPESFQIAPAFRDQLKKVWQAYLPFKNALVASDPEKAASRLSDLKKALTETDMSLLEGDAHIKWMEQYNKMIGVLEDINGKGDLEALRKALAPISEALFESIRKFRIGDGKIYYQYCPMAFDNQGAYWLSEIEEINNPYFGDMMLRCGETREIVSEK